jgi:hypothetical protein
MLVDIRGFGHWNQAGAQWRAVLQGWSIGLIFLGEAEARCLFPQPSGFEGLGRGRVGVESHREAVAERETCPKSFRPGASLPLALSHAESSTVPFHPPFPDSVMWKTPDAFCPRSLRALVPMSNPPRSAGGPATGKELGGAPGGK